MSRTKKIVRNCSFILIALCLFIKFSGYYSTPESAHKAEEQRMHYGPSKIEHIEDYEKGKYLLCKYDKWISCDVIDRSLFFMWSIGSGDPEGVEYNSSNPFDYYFHSSTTSNVTYTYIYGIVNDPSITKIEVTLKNGDVLTQTNFYDGTFIIHWTDKTGTFTKVSAYDQNGNSVENKKYQKAP